MSGPEVVNARLHARLHGVNSQISRRDAEDACGAADRRPHISAAEGTQGGTLYTAAYSVTALSGKPIPRNIPVG